jgi:hypothetical protein
MNIALWIGQALLAFVCVVSGSLNPGRAASG